MNYTSKVHDNIVRLTKRDADIDSVISVLKNKNISNYVLSYRDYKIENNILEKRNILEKIVYYLEPKKKTA